MKDIDGYVTKDDLYRLISRIKRNPDVVVDDETCHIIVVAISNMPSTDVQPIKQGYWIWDSSPILGNPYGSYRCSECGNRMKFMESYCSGCGAKMVEENENETD